jgi:hypothetical protein
MRASRFVLILASIVFLISACLVNVVFAASPGADSPAPPILPKQFAEGQ